MEIRLMLVGLMSDSHDRVPAIRELATRLAAKGVELVLHAGDFCAPFSLAPFRDLNLPLACLFVINDGDHEGLKAYAAMGMGMELYESPHSMDVAGHRIMLVHDVGELAQRSIETHAIIVHGFTHRSEMKERGDTLLINPGEACGWLRGTPTCAVLDIDSRKLEYLSLTEPEWKF